MTADGASSAGMLINVWGAGGSAPTGRAARARYGGDTVCFEIRREPGAVPLVIDLGTGARDLGKALFEESGRGAQPIEAEVLLSHLHLDHIMGAPFFTPFYLPDSRVRVRCGLSPNPGYARRKLERMASEPYFPVRPLEMSAPEWGVFAPGETFEAAGMQVTAIALNHPGGCCGFRIESAHGAICVIGDHEHGDPAIDAAVAQAVQGAALMVYDAAYDDCEYEKYRGWGHSTWRKGAELARSAGVGGTIFHHHPPEYSDDDLAAREADVQAEYPEGWLAHQGGAWRIRGGRAEPA